MKTKKHCHANNIKIENDKFLKVCIENRMYHYFDDITKFKHINSDNILICKK